MLCGRTVPEVLSEVVEGEALLKIQDRALSAEERDQLICILMKLIFHEQIIVAPKDFLEIRFQIGVAFQKEVPFWAMRFEAKHKESKIYCNSITSRRNPTKTISIKAAFKFSQFLIKYKHGLPNEYNQKDFNKNFLDGSIILLLLNKNINSDNVFSSNEIIYQKTTYLKDMYIGIRTEMCKFYKILKLLLIENVIYVVVQSVLTE